MTLDAEIREYALSTTLDAFREEVPRWLDSLGVLQREIDPSTIRAFADLTLRFIDDSPPFSLLVAGEVARWTAEVRDRFPYEAALQTQGPTVQMALLDSLSAGPQNHDREWLLDLLQDPMTEKGVFRHAFKAVSRLPDNGGSVNELLLSLDDSDLQKLGPTLADELRTHNWTPSEDVLDRLLTHSSASVRLAAVEGVAREGGRLDTRISGILMSNIFTEDSGPSVADLKDGSLDALIARGATDEIDAIATNSTVDDDRRLRAAEWLSRERPRSAARVLVLLLPSLTRADQIARAACKGSRLMS